MRAAITMSAISGFSVSIKKAEFYQISLGGAADETASLGDITGRAFTEDTIVDAVETLVETYLDQRGPVSVLSTLIAASAWPR